MDRFLIAPHGINFHREHHLNPRIPFFALQKAHQALATQHKTMNLFETYWGKNGALADPIAANNSTQIEAKRSTLEAMIMPTRSPGQ